MFAAGVVSKLTFSASKRLQLACVTSNRKALKFFFGKGGVLIPCFPNAKAVPKEIGSNVQWMLNVQSGRRAFDATMKDPEFMAELAASRVELGPMVGEELQKLVADLSAVPPAIIDKVKALYPLN